MTLVVVIVEGAEISILQSEATAGRLPWIANALREGTLWDMHCGPAPYEPSNLASAFTGLGRGHHGCYSYWAIRSANGARPGILRSDDVRRPFIWHWPEIADLNVAVLNVQLTHPPKPVNGVLLSYLMEQTLRYSHPADLVHDMKRHGIPYGHDVSVFYQGEALDDYFERIVKVSSYQLEAAIALGRDRDILIVNLTIIDRLSHFLWHELEESRDEKNEPCVIKGYRFLDHALTKLETLAGNDPMVVFSEIGFGAVDEFVSLDNYLFRSGLQRRTATGEIDEAHSVAREAVQGSHGIVLLGKASGEPSAIEEVRACLAESKDKDGNPVLACTWRRDEIYDGNAVSDAPEIIVEPADPRRPPLGDPRWASHVNRRLQTGWHRDSGFVLVRGAKPIHHEAESIAPESIAPTIMALVGRDPPSRCRAPALAIPP